MIRKISDITKLAEARLNLSYGRIFRVPLKRAVFYLVIILATASVFTGSTLLAPVNPAQTLAAQNDAERQILEAQLVELEKQITQQEAVISDYQKQGKTLQKEIASLNAKTSKLNLQIKAINLALTRLDSEISENKDKIQTTEEKITLNKGALSSFVRKVYENDRLSLVAVMLKNPRLSDFFGDFNNVVAIQSDLVDTVNRITELRGDLIDATQALALKRSDQARLKVDQDSQKKLLESAKRDKNNLLSDTKGQESKYQAILKEARKTASQIRSRIFEFLGGGELSFEEAYKFAQFAEQATGVRAAMILAVLDRESALGQNVGRCNYKAAMHPTRDVPIFLTLLASLNINPDTVMVSCANSDGAYGGAMGPAQFIPSTWNLYKAKVADITGSNPPSPWRNGDAFAATALYLKDAMRGCDAIYSRQTDKERCAAAKYYAGGRWRNHLWGYGDRVVTKANQFQSDIELINS